jgi:hypothetical protein
LLDEQGGKFHDNKQKKYEVDTMAFDPAGCTDSRFYNSISHSDDCEKQLL